MVVRSRFKVLHLSLVNTKKFNVIMVVRSRFKHLSVLLRSHEPLS